MKTNKLCGKCRQPVEKETKLDYPYYCPHCDENLYEFETVQEATRKVIRREIYSAEEAAHSVELYAFMQENGLKDKVGPIGGKHHEIYLSDPRKAAPDKMKTVLRHPVVKN